jgi:hypothetical protein
MGTPSRKLPIRVWIGLQKGRALYMNPAGQRSGPLLPQATQAMLRSTHTCPQAQEKCVAGRLAADVLT